MGRQVRCFGAERNETRSPAGAECHGIVDILWNDRFSIEGIRTPSHNTAIALQGQGMILAGRDGDHVGKTGWYIQLPRGVVRTPGHHGAIGLERDAVSAAGGHGHHITQA
jgi:hypothetical protein